MGAVIRDHERHPERKKKVEMEMAHVQTREHLKHFSYKKASRAAWAVFPPQGLQKEPTLPTPWFWRTMRE